MTYARGARSWAQRETASTTVQATKATQRSRISVQCPSAIPLGRILLTLPRRSSGKSGATFRSTDQGTELFGTQTGYPYPLHPSKMNQLRIISLQSIINKEVICKV